MHHRLQHYLVALPVMGLLTLSGCTKASNQEAASSGQMQKSPTNQAKPSTLPNPIPKLKDCKLDGEFLGGLVYFTDDAAGFGLGQRVIKVYETQSLYSDLSIYIDSEGSSAWRRCGVWQITTNSARADIIVFLSDSQMSSDINVDFVQSSFYAGLNK